MGWLLAAPVIPMSKEKAEGLLASAVRGKAGGLFPLVADLGPKARAATVEDVARETDIIITAIQRVWMTVR